MLLEGGDVVRALLYRKGEGGKREKTGRSKSANPRMRNTLFIRMVREIKKEGTVFTVPSLGAALLMLLRP
jgi:hypothetical protein